MFTSQGDPRGRYRFSHPREMHVSTEPGEIQVFTAWRDTGVSHPREMHVSTEPGEIQVFTAWSDAGFHSPGRYRCSSASREVFTEPRYRFQPGAMQVFKAGAVQVFIASRDTGV